MSREPGYDTKRLLDGDICELRSRYLADFAYLLHISPPDVDRLRMYDWAQLVLWIDEYYKASEKGGK